MTKTTTVQSFAKINWMLRILGIRDDGYHDLETIFQSISLSDTLQIETADEFTFHCDEPSIPGGEANLVVKAYRLMKEELDLPPVRITLQKRIPAGGGLGGGSSNAAAAIRALVPFADRSPASSRLAEIALELGSDVPFFLHGGAAYGKGRGELLTRLPDPPGIPLLLLLPEERISTAEAFRLLDERRKSAKVDLEPSGADATFRMMLELGFQDAGRLLENDFEPVIFGQHPHFAVLRESLVREGAFWARMSGSGSTIAGAFPDLATRDHACEVLRKEVNVVTAETIRRAEAL